ncbi:GNAT family N-acetyltransferase [Azospirillum sp. A39]|uniref:GNAT family N-acetyltransferase n=1 Tax=Azospirillum sp. A39 TaxID=3462279 RepID=UPI0040464D59
MDETSGAAAHAVRQLGAADAAAFRALHLEALRAHPAAFAMAYEEECDLPLTAFRTRLDQQTVFGGFVAGALAGIATLQRHAPLKRRHVAMLWGMYVKEEVRGAGLAAAILRAAIARAEREVDQLELYVAVGNDRAGRFYRRFGFEPYGVMRRSLRVDGVDHDAEMMVRMFR